jgi:CHAT domain-containing protein
MSSEATPAGALALAEEARALVQVSPRRALTLAEQARAAATAEGDVKAEVASLHALAWAQHVLGDPRAAATARTGIRIGERHGDRRGIALLRRRLATSHAFAGEMRAARREIDAAVALLSGRDRAESEVFRVGIHFSAHTSDPAIHREVMAAAGRALRVFRKEGDAIWEARLLFNRGLLLSDRGELDGAEADFRRAYALYTRAGAEDAALDAIGALAEIARLRGDVLGCLTMLDEVQATLHGRPLPYNLQEYRASALAQARLLPEARAAAEAYIELCHRTGRRGLLETTLLDLAAIAAMSNDAASARQLATRAARSFAAGGKPVSAALARALCLRAQLLEGSLTRSSLRSGLKAAALLDTAGWRRDALRTRLLLTRVALDVGSRRTASRQFQLARSLRTGGTATDRIECAHTHALLRLAEGKRAVAERLLETGLRELGDYRAALGAVELRATAAGIGVELSQTGLRIAVDSGKPAKVLAWAERLRGSTLRLPLVRPPADPALRDLQVELRRIGSRIREAEETGRTTQRLAANQAKLEAAIRARTRLLRGGGEARTTATDPREAARLLGERVLVEYVELDGLLQAVTLADGRLSLHELGRDTGTAELEWLRFALGRLARGRSDSAQRAAALENARVAATALDKLLVEPLLPQLGDAPLVLVPTGPLHALPWGALPSLRDRPLVVTPSLSVWLDLARLPRSRRRKTTLIAGPRLRHSAAEVRDVASLLSNPTVLHGKAATARAALTALDGVALAHIACHGRFRSDSPLFSSLELADGPLNVYELQRLRRAPETVVLSSCDLALSDLHPGDELLGLAAALLGMGTRTIVASVVPVPDAAAKRLMLAFHRNLLAGDAPAAALARAQARLSVAGFVCLGSG